MLTTKRERASSTWPGPAKYMSPTPATQTIVLAARNAFLRPLPSASAPRTGEERATMIPVTVTAFAHCAVPVTTSSAICCVKKTA